MHNKDNIVDKVLLVKLCINAAKVGQMGGWADGRGLSHTPDKHNSLSHARVCINDIAYTTRVLQMSYET